MCVAVPTRMETTINASRAGGQKVKPFSLGFQSRAKTLRQEHGERLLHKGIKQPKRNQAQRQIVQKHAME